MRNFGMFPVVVAMVMSVGTTSYGQRVEAEVPGDHFSLEGALELFKKSESPEEFEKLLNSRDSKVNNLDLNGDGYIDYIRVLDHYKGNVHAFILQAVISDRESQDIAVIELEKLSNGKAVLQIVGNEDIYGIETIIEPTREVRTYAGTTSSYNVVNVWGWPSVQYVYGPYYRGWSSPWDWHHRPVWWHSWRPIAYVHYHPIWRPYRPHYSYCDTRRVVYAHHIYHPHRRTSVVVRDRYHSNVVRYRQEYRDGHRDRRDRNDRGSYAHDSRPNRSQPSRGYDRNHLRDDDSNSQQTSRGRDDSSNEYRRPSNRGAVVTPNRPSSRERNVDPDLYRNSRRLENNTPQTRNPVTVPQNRSTRQPAVSPPDMSRKQYAPQRPANRERTAPPQVERNSSRYNRSVAPPRNQVITPGPGIRQQPPSRPSTLNRNTPGSRQMSPQGPPNRAAAANRSREIKRGVD